MNAERMDTREYLLSLKARMDQQIKRQLELNKLIDALPEDDKQELYDMIAIQEDEPSDASRGAIEIDDDPQEWQQLATQDEPITYIDWAGIINLSFKINEAVLEEFCAAHALAVKFHNALAAHHKITASPGPIWNAERQPINGSVDVEIFVNDNFDLDEAELWNVYEFADFIAEHTGWQDEAELARAETGPKMAQYIKQEIEEIMLGVLVLVVYQALVRARHGDVLSDENYEQATRLNLQSLRKRRPGGKSPRFPWTFSQKQAFAEYYVTYRSLLENDAKSFLKKYPNDWRVMLKQIDMGMPEGFYSYIPDLEYQGGHGASELALQIAACKTDENYLAASEDKFSDSDKPWPLDCRTLFRRVPGEYKTKPGRGNIKRTSRKSDQKPS
jgi:hypothetical protein